MQLESTQSYEDFALRFVEALTQREYATAYAMTSNDYQVQTSLDQLREAFEDIVPVDWGDIGPIEAGEMLADWPGKQAADIGWVYVSIGGDVYSEAVSVVITRVSGAYRVREVEFGRP